MNIFEALEYLCRNPKSVLVATLGAQEFDVTMYDGRLYRRIGAGRWLGWAPSWEDHGRYTFRLDTRVSE